MIGFIISFYFMQATSNFWQQMKHEWGVNWILKSTVPLKAPFSIRLTSLSGRKTLIAKNVIPDNWQPNVVYTSNVNY